MLSENNLGIRIVHTIAPWFRVQPLSYRLIGVDIYYVHSHYFVKEYYKITRHTLPLVLRSPADLYHPPAYTLPRCWTSRHLMLYCTPFHDVKRGQRTADGAIT